MDNRRQRWEVSSSLDDVDDVDDGMLFCRVG